MQSLKRVGWVGRRGELVFRSKKLFRQISPLFRPLLPFVRLFSWLSCDTAIKQRRVGAFHRVTGSDRFLSNTNTNTNIDTDTNINVDTNTDADTNTNADTNIDTDTNTDADTITNTDTNINVDTNTDADTNTNADTNIDADTNKCKCKYS